MAIKRTALFARHTPGGIFTINNEALNTGNIFWVNSVTGADTTGNGTNPDSPFATLAYACTQCTASNDDRIYVMAGHSENISAAAKIVPLAGVSIIGLGQGDSRPTFVVTTALGTLTMTGANAKIVNCIFDLSQTSAIVSCSVVSAAGCEISGCYFIMGAAGTGTAPLQAILTTAGANDLTVDSNRFIGPGATPTTIAAATGCIALVGGNNIKITNNVIQVFATTSVGGISNVTTACTNVTIEHNMINNETASSTKAITLLSGSTGVIANNRLAVLSGTAPITSAAAFWLNNYYAAAAATAATIL
jgi:hypothetical protein